MFSITFENIAKMLHFGSASALSNASAGESALAVNLAGGSGWVTKKTREPGRTAGGLDGAAHSTRPSAGARGSLRARILIARARLPSPGTLARKLFRRMREFEKLLRPHAIF